MRQAAESFDEVTGDAPLPVFVEHGRNGLDSRVFVLEASVVSKNNVFAIGRSGKSFRVGCALDLSGLHGTQRAAQLSKN